MKICKIFRWECAHRLVNHKGKCRSIHGHSYLLEVEVMGLIQDKFKFFESDDGMVIDFGDFKEVVKEYVVDKFDHALIINSLSIVDEDIAKYLEEKIDQKVLRLKENVTAENMVNYIFDVLDINLPRHLKLSRIRLYETPTCYAEVNINDEGKRS